MRTTEGESLFWLGYDNFMFSHSWFISLCRIISKATGVLTYFYFRLFVSIVEVFHQTIILFHFISHFGANFMFNIIFSFEAIIIFEVIFIFQVILIFEIIFIRGKGQFQGIVKLQAKSLDQELTLFYPCHKNNKNKKKNP